VPYYGSVGTVSNNTQILNSGRCEVLDQFPSSMESQFRQLGLQVKLVDSKWYLLSDFEVCTAGKKLTPEQVKMIVNFLFKLETFRYNA
jgi:Insertion domain in 60S ribosomal protein L10P